MERRNGLGKGRGYGSNKVSENRQTKEDAERCDARSLKDFGAKKIIWRRKEKENGEN